MYGQQVPPVLITGMIMFEIFRYLLLKFNRIINYNLLLYLLCFCIYIVNVRLPLEDVLHVFRIANASKEDVLCRHVQPIGKRWNLYLYLS